MTDQVEANICMFYIDTEGRPNSQCFDVSIVLKISEGIEMAGKNGEMM
jgi:hypothetical protein